MRKQKRIPEYLRALVVGMTAIVCLVGCVDTRENPNREEASEESQHGSTDSAYESEQHDDALQARPLQELIQAEDDHFWVVNLVPTDGDYYFGDLTKGPNRGWYGSYGGEYVAVEIDDIRYINDVVRFVMKTFGNKALEDGTVLQTEPSYYTVDITRAEIMEAIEAFRAGETDVVLLEAQAVPMVGSE